MKQKITREEQMRRYCLQKMASIVQECHGSIRQEDAHKEAWEVFCENKYMFTHIVVEVASIHSLCVPNPNFHVFVNYFGGYLYDECMPIFQFRKEAWERDN